MKKNVLIFGGGAYNAQEVYFALKDTLRFHPILASSNDNHSTFISRDAIIDLPYDSDENFINELNKCIERQNISYIIPTHDTNAVVLMKNKDKINAIIVCSPLETTEICRSKRLTYKILENMEFIPKIYTRETENIQFPIFAKDNQGQGGKNAFKLESYSDFEKLDAMIDYVICEYLPGEEITVDCFTDRKGCIRFAQPRNRTRIMNGISARTTTIELTQEIQKIVEGVSSRIKFRGYWYLQCKQDKDGVFKLMEVSTRFAGTFNLSKNLDVNLPLLALCDFSEMDIEICPNNYKVSLDKSYIDRYKLDYEYKRVYMDFDDTLVFDRKRYNTEAIRFIYQCLNKGIRLVLITKHAYNLQETMKNMRFNMELFDEVIELPLEIPKYCYMDNEIPSIFIDNAFAERKAVKEKLGIPTFDVTNIECLIDWCE